MKMHVLNVSGTIFSSLSLKAILFRGIRFILIGRHYCKTSGKISANLLLPDNIKNGELAAARRLAIAKQIDKFAAARRLAIAKSR